MKKFKKYNYHNHIIIFANKSVNIFDVLYDIRIEYLNKKILILSENIKSFPSDEFPFNKVSVIHIENLIDFKFLERINTKYAKCILFSKI